jgi:hypothetical protein
MDQPDEQEIDFGRAEFEQPRAPGLACGSCNAALTTYHTLNGTPRCDGCLQRANEAHQGSFFKALLLGGVAAALGAALYYGIYALTDSQLGLVAIVVGIMVGVGVRMGAGGRTSMVYRLMAVGFAYLAITSTFVPDIVESMMQPDAAEAAADVDSAAVAEPQEASAAAYVVGFVIAWIAPALFVANGEIILLIILLIGLWEAWRLSAPRDHEVLGPFTIERAQVDAAVAEATPVAEALPIQEGTPGTGT